MSLLLSYLKISNPLRMWKFVSLKQWGPDKMRVEKLLVLLSLINFIYILGLCYRLVRGRKYCKYGVTEILEKN